MTAGPDRQSLMDELLRAGVPEVKLGLGEVIDKENARPLPPRYARLLPETLLVITLRPDAADALEPIAVDLERELTDSCTRHGSLYDRSYRVRLQRSADSDAPLYVITTHAGKDLGEQEPAVEAAAPSSEEGQDARKLPVEDTDATRLGEIPADWEPGRWVLVVEGESGEEREAFRLGEPVTTVGRRAEDPELRASIAISDAPHVSRRQLALVWENRDGAAGFKIYNLGLNAVHMPGISIPGSRAGRESLDLAAISEEHTGWLPAGVPLRIGDHGPTVRVEEVPPDPDAEEIDVDPDATVFE